MKKNIGIGLTLLLLTLGCRNNQKSGEIINLESIEINEKNAVINPLDTVGRGYPIFYNMYLSVEISTLFKTSDVVYNSEILNSYNKISDYITSDQKALNIGVYAVDLSYARVFEQYEIAGQYLTSIQLLSQKLNIPNDYFQEIIIRYEANLDIRDSIIAIANEVYHDVESSLIKNERYSTAALIVLGGWVEAMHIASELVTNSNDIGIHERYAEQKYSLNNLIVMLSEHKDNNIVKKYLLELYELNRTMQQINYRFTSDPDKNQKQLDDNHGKIQQVAKQITMLRNEIVN